MAMIWVWMVHKVVEWRDERSSVQCSLLSPGIMIHLAGSSDRSLRAASSKSYLEMPASASVNVRSVAFCTNISPMFLRR
ncbi:hypothetical protein PISMIDRAFT_683819, partial [Pisolithus microcarpus 441]